jgi:hypothetical protein
MPPLPLRRFSVEEYHAMIEAGILGESEPVELLEGWIVDKMPRGPGHDYVLAALLELLSRLPSSVWAVRVQSALTLSTSEPEPDVKVVRGPKERYKKRHPHAKDTALVIEVSESSLDRDSTTKQRVFAREGIPIYWIVNLPQRQVEAYTQPSGPTKNPRYRKCDIYRRDDEVPLVLDGKENRRIPVREILP